MRDFIYSLFWIGLSLFLGRGIGIFWDVAVPTSILGLLVLLTFMLTGVCKAIRVSTVSQLLIKNIPLLIIPVSVGLMVKLDVLQSNLLILIISVVGGTVLTILVLASTLKTLLRE